MEPHGGRDLCWFCSLVYLKGAEQCPTHTKRTEIQRAPLKHLALMKHSPELGESEVKPYNAQGDDAGMVVCAG